MDFVKIYVILIVAFAIMHMTNFNKKKGTES